MVRFFSSINMIALEIVIILLGGTFFHIIICVEIKLKILFEFFFACRRYSER